VTNAPDGDLESLFSSPFLALDPGSMHSLTPQALAKALPARREMFDAAGITNIRRIAAAESVLDVQHRLLRVQWAAERVPGPSITLCSTFLVRNGPAGMRIAVYLNHTNLREELARSTAAADSPASH
jgi:hypothetical protein